MPETSPMYPEILATLNRLELFFREYALNAVHAMSDGEVAIWGMTEMDDRVTRGLIKELKRRGPVHAC